MFYAILNYYTVYCYKRAIYTYQTLDIMWHGQQLYYQRLLSDSNTPGYLSFKRRMLFTPCNVPLLSTSLPALSKENSFAVVSIGYFSV